MKRVKEFANGGQTTHTGIESPNEQSGYDGENEVADICQLNIQL